MKVREHTKQDSSLTLKEVFSGRVSPELKLYFRTGKVFKSHGDENHGLLDFAGLWRGRAEQEANLARRKKRAVRSLSPAVWSFVLAELRLKEPLVIAGGNRYHPGRADRRPKGWQLSAGVFGCVFPWVIRMSEKLIERSHTIIIESRRLTTTAKETAGRSPSRCRSLWTHNKCILSDWKSPLLKVQNETSSKSAL